MLGAFLKPLDSDPALRLVHPHTLEEVVDKVTFFPYFRLSSDSHTQVLISYRLGKGGHTDTCADIVFAGAWLINFDMTISPQLRIVCH
jgi:hypothetical protein